MKKKQMVLLAAGVAALLGTGITLDLLKSAGTFLEISPHSPAPAEIVSGFHGGTEDFALDGSDLYISSADFRDASRLGHIYVLNTATRAYKDVTPKLDFPFHPHGIALSKEGHKRLFVVNHRDGSALSQGGTSGDESEQTIEIFDVNQHGLTWVKSIHSPLFTSPNDVAAADQDTLYITNDHRYRDGLLRVFEDYARVRWGTVVRCAIASGQCEVVIKDTLYANGIEVVDGTLLVAETTGRALKLFEIGDPLTLTKTIPCDSGVDNIMIDPADNSWWIGAHPQLLKFVRHAAKASNRSPSQVLRIDPESHAVREVYLNDGDPLSGSSVAVRVNGTVWVGAVFETKVLNFADSPAP